MSNYASPATQSQMTKIAQLLGRQRPGQSWPELKIVAENDYGVDLDTMTIDEASHLIDRLLGMEKHPWKGSHFGRRVRR